MNLRNKKVICIGILVIILLILTIIFFPKNIHTCRGDSVCFGLIKSETRTTTWLNADEGTLENREEVVKSCIGSTLQWSVISDGCPGDWGWCGEVPVSCNASTSYCNERIIKLLRPISLLSSSGMIPTSRDQQVAYETTIYKGIACSEWIRACNELAHKDKVSIKITKLNETGAYVGTCFVSVHTDKVKYTGNRYKSRYKKGDIITAEIINNLQEPIWVHGCNALISEKKTRNGFKEKNIIGIGVICKLAPAVKIPAGETKTVEYEIAPGYNTHGTFRLRLDAGQNCPKDTIGVNACEHTLMRYSNEFTIV